MTRTKLRGHRGATSAVLIVGGGALCVGTWVGGEHGLAVVLFGFCLLAAVVAYLWSGRDSDVAAIIRAGGDERQRRLDRDATAISGLAMATAAIIGAVVESARNHGDIGAYGVIAAVGGLSYVVSLLVLRRTQ
jgi:predicted tellurium resistance membrane protein TerC